MRRRAFVVGMAAVMLTRFSAEAQQPGKVSRVGLVGLTGRTSLSLPVYQAFRRRLAELGWAEAKNLIFEARWAEGQMDRLPQLMADVLSVRPDVIYVVSSAAAVAAKKANTTIPIVFSHVTDPVASGVVSAFGRHASNITGVTYSVPETAGKLLELLRELRPSLRRALVIWTAGQPGKLPEVAHLVTAAHSLGVRVVRLEVKGASDYAKLLSQPPASNPDAIVFLADPLSFTLRTQLAEFAAKHRIPAVYQQRGYAEAGGLMSYGIDDVAVGSRIAELVDKVLRGTSPVDLPVEQPTKFDLIVNLKTARALNLTIPPSLLLRADQVIE